ncbi:ribosomal L7Ae/L30e/S12e/Gadd45 family protein [Candidatus Woesearchaeota archaeon]|nr:ribosomal L7Ae/L30e/S12e/Gadd45 family protein [Candidatus Woesearchaeota archaeon]
MAKRKTDTIIDEIKDKIAEKKILIGTEETLKNLKLGKLQKIFLASNCEDGAKEDITHYGKLTKTEIVNLKYPNDEFGTLCKKPFSISVAGLLKV